MKELIEDFYKRLRNTAFSSGFGKVSDEAISYIISEYEKCKAALSQKQEVVEPFGYFICDSQDSSEDFTRFKPDSINDSEQIIPLYTAPPSTARGFGVNKSENVSGKQSCDSKVSDKAQEVALSQKQEAVSEIYQIKYGLGSWEEVDREQYDRFPASKDYQLRTLYTAPPSTAQDVMVMVPVDVVDDAIKLISPKTKSGNLNTILMARKTIDALAASKWE